MELFECDRCGVQADAEGSPSPWGKLSHAPDMTAESVITCHLCPACVERALEKPETGTHPFVEVKGACGVCGSARFTSLHPAAVVRQVLSA